MSNNPPPQFPQGQYPQKPYGQQPYGQQPYGGQYPPQMPPARKRKESP